MAKVQGKKIAANAMWIIGARIAQSLISVVVAMLTARYLGPSNYGIINYAASLAAFALPITKLGIPSVLVYEFVNHPEEEGKILGSSMILSVLSSFLCIVGVTAYAYLCNPGEPETVLVCALYSIVLVFQALEVTLKWFQAHLMAKYSAIIMMIASFVISGYRVFLLATGKSVYWFALTSSIDFCIISVLMYIVYRKKGGEKARFSGSVARRIFRRSKFYIVSGLATVIYWQIDKIMIKQILGAEEAGIYSAAVTVALMTQFVFEALTDSLRPAIFEAKARDPELFIALTKKLYCIILYLALAQSLVLSLGSRIIISVMYGADYLGAIPSLSVLAWFAAFSYFGEAQSVWILATKNQRFMLPISLVGALVNVLLNYCLIRTVGIIGAGIATVITFFITSIGAVVFIRELRPSLGLMLRSIYPGYALGLLKTFIKIRKKEKVQ